MGMGETFPAWTVMYTLLGVGLGSCSAGALNNYVDRKLDQKMKRTADRPLPQGHIEPLEGLLVGLISGLVGTFILAWYVNWLTAGLLAFTIFFYVVVYTMYLKRTTPLGTEIGGIAGSMPPVIGWFAVNDLPLSIENLWIPMILFGLMFVWQGPHFWALGIMYEDDYRRAGIPIFPVVDEEHRQTRNRILFYSILMIVLSVVLFTVGGTGYVYLTMAGLLGGYLVVHLIQFWRQQSSRKAAQSLFSCLNLHLFLLFIGMFIDAQ